MSAGMLGKPTSARQGHPLALTFERARALDAEYMRAVLGASEDAPSLRGRDLTSGAVDLLATHARPHCGGAIDYLGASVAHIVSDAVLAATLPPLLLEDRLPRLTLDGLVFRPHTNEPWIDRVWLTDPRFRALGSDRDSAHPDAEVVDDRDALDRLFTSALADVLGPVFAEIRRRAPFGVIGMWGQAVDGIFSMSLWLSQHTDGDAGAAWSRASATVDHLAARVTHVRGRPRPFPVRTPDGDERLFPVRGTCCLWYKSQPDPPDVGYCTTCPLRDDEDRHTRLVQYLADEGVA
jgi:hypothetical protein